MNTQSSNLLRTGMFLPSATSDIQIQQRPKGDRHRKNLTTKARRNSVMVKKMLFSIKVMMKIAKSLGMEKKP